MQDPPALRKLSVDVQRRRAAPAKFTDISNELSSTYHNESSNTLSVDVQRRRAAPASFTDISNELSRTYHNESCNKLSVDVSEGGLLLRPLQIYLTS
ncbi:hypothetical protein J6590_068448 [Homalodisca vitripennis]|nr:hypothetical protein J6590_068448 [Homalodisca vitripennis]